MWCWPTAPNVQHIDDSAKSCTQLWSTARCACACDLEVKHVIIESKKPEKLCICYCYCQHEVDTPFTWNDMQGTWIKFMTLWIWNQVEKVKEHLNLNDFCIFIALMQPVRSLSLQTWHSDRQKSNPILGHYRRKQQQQQQQLRWRCRNS